MVTLRRDYRSVHQGPPAETTPVPEVQVTPREEIPTDANLSEAAESIQTDSLKAATEEKVPVAGRPVRLAGWTIMVEHDGLTIRRAEGTEHGEEQSSSIVRYLGEGGGRIQVIVLRATEHTDANPDQTGASTNGMQQQQSDRDLDPNAGT